MASGHQLHLIAMVSGGGVCVCVRQVWFCIVVAVAAVGPFLYLVTRLLVHVLDHPDQTRYTPQELTFNMYRNLMVQNNLITTSSWVLKLIFFGWYLFSFYIYGESVLLRLCDMTK